MEEKVDALPTNQLSLIPVKVAFVVSSPPFAFTFPCLSIGSVTKERETVDSRDSRLFLPGLNKVKLEMRKYRSISRPKPTKRGAL